MCDLLAMFRAAACGRQPVPEWAADTGKLSYFSVCCGKASNGSSRFPVLVGTASEQSWAVSSSGVEVWRKEFQRFAGFKISETSVRPFDRTATGNSKTRA